MMLLLSAVATAAPPPSEIPEPPAVLAELQVKAAGDAQPERVVLQGLGVWSGRSLGGDPTVHRHDVHTGLTPKLGEGAGTVAWLVGHRLAARLEPGDTVVTYSLLVEVSGSGESVRALWYHDSQEIPRSYAWGSGRLERAKKSGTADRLSLHLSDLEYGDTLVIEGVIRGLSDKLPSPPSKDVKPGAAKP